MVDAGFSPTCSIFSWFVDGFCRKKNADVVLLIPDELTKRGLPLDKAAYRSLIRRLCRKELVEKAQMVFDRSEAAHTLLMDSQFPIMLASTHEHRELVEFFFLIQGRFQLRHIGALMVLL